MNTKKQPPAEKQPRFKVKVDGVVIGWFDTLAEAEKAQGDAVEYNKKRLEKAGFYS